MFSDIFVLFSSCCLLVRAGEEEERGTNINKETNIKTVDLKGAAALANELRQLEKKTEETNRGGTEKKTRKGSEDAEEEKKGEKEKNKQTQDSGVDVFSANSKHQDSSVICTHI